MYELAFAILLTSAPLTSAARPATLGRSVDSPARVLAYAERRAAGLRRERKAGVNRPAGRGSKIVNRARSTPNVGRRAIVEPKPSARTQPSRARAARTSTTSGTAAPAVKSRRAAGSRAPATVTFPSGASLTVVKGREQVGQEHYDPTGSGNPLLDTKGANRSTKLSDNFSVGEIARSGKKMFDVARIDPRHVACLQAIRDYVGKPVLVRSGYRSFWYNVEVYRRMGKKPSKSQHISGKASDIWIPGMTGLEVAKVAIDACGPNLALGLGLEYAHVDVRGYPGVWGYDGVPRQQTAELERYRVARRVAMRGSVNRRRRVPVSKRT